jgi:hypothetical protein
MNTTDAEVKLATKFSLGGWDIISIDTLYDYNFSLMGKQPIDIDLKDDLFVVCSSTKKVKEFVLGADLKIKSESLIYNIIGLDSSLTQTVSFENDNNKFKHYTVGVMINGEENIYYGTNKIFPDNVDDFWNVIEVYPNPFTKDLIINGVSENVSLYNSLGAEVLKIDLSLSNKIDFSFIAPGTYYLKSNNSYAPIIKR